MGARVSFYSSLEVLGTKEAKLERLNRVQTPGLGFLPKQGLLAESENRLAESKVQSPRLIPLLLGELVHQLAESKAKMHYFKNVNYMEYVPGTMCYMRGSDAPSGVSEL